MEMPLQGQLFVDSTDLANKKYPNASDSQDRSTEDNRIQAQLKVHSLALPILPHNLRSKGFKGVDCMQPSLFRIFCNCGQT